MFKSVFKTGIRGIYNVSDNASFQTDMWSVYPAKHKQTGKVVSVFIFDKTKFESSIHRMCSLSPNTKNPKLIINECYELVRYEVSQLTKLKHPQILTIIEVLEETKLKFLFVSESVVANLATLDLNKEDELSIQKGLLEISKGLQFLHNFCSIIHLNIQPLSIYVNAQGDWKLAGFKFLQNLNELSPLERENFYIMNNSSLVPFANLNLNYTSPELIVDSSSQKLSTANDLWSLGMLIFFLYNKGDHLINCFDPNSPSDFKGEFRSFEQKFYNHRPSELRYLLKDVPESLWIILTQLLARYPNDRINIDQFIDSDYFNGSLIKMMWFIDEFSTKSMDDRLIFLDGLLTKDDLLLKLPGTFKHAKLLPLLIEVISNELKLLSSKKLTMDTDQLISNSLLVILKIGQDLSSLSFQDRIYESLLNTTKSRKADASPLVALSKTSVKVRLALVSNFELLTKKLQAKQVTEIVKEIANSCLTFASSDVDLPNDQIQLQDLFLGNLFYVADLFDFPYLKNTLFPLLCQVFKTTTVLSTKLQTLATFQMLIDKKAIDRVIVTEQLLPVIENLKSRNKRIVANVLQFFVKLVQSEHISLDLEVSTDKVLVQCLRLAFGCNDCSKQEFKGFMASIVAMQNNLEDRKLGTLSEGSVDAIVSFDSLINSPLLRQGTKDDVTKAPLLKPMAPKKTENVKTPTSQTPSGARVMTQSKPLVLKPQMPPLSFGATSSHSTPKPRSSLGITSNINDDVHGCNSSPQKSTSITESAIDWSTAKTQTSVLKPQTYSQPIMQPKIVQSQAGSNISSPPGIKLPPGFDANTVLTPNSTGPASTQNGNKNPENLLDFL